MPTPSPFGVRLRETRERRDLTQLELAERAGLTPVQISHFETGVKPSASAVTLIKLAHALSVTVDYLLGRTDDMKAVGGPAAVVLRSLQGASTETIERVADIARALTARDRRNDS